MRSNERAQVHRTRASLHSLHALVNQHGFQYSVRRLDLPPSLRSLFPNRHQSSSYKAKRPKPVLHRNAAGHHLCWSPWGYYKNRT